MKSSMNGEQSNMFDFLSKTVRLATNVATLPASAVADALTAAGVTTDRKEPYSVTKAKRISDDTCSLLDDILGTK